MQRKNKLKNQLIIVLTIVVGIVAAVLIHQNTWFKFRSSRAEIPGTTEIQANDTTNGTDTTSIGIDDLGRTVVTWADNNGTDTDTYFRLYAKDGTPESAETIATVTTTGDQFQPAVTKDEKGNFVITWVGYNTGSSTYDIYARAFQPDGTPVGGEIVVNTSTINDDLNPAIAIDYNGPENTSRFVISWTHNNGTDRDIYFRIYDVDFTQTTNPPSAFNTETLMHTGYTGDQTASDVAMNNLGQFIISAGHDPGSADIILYRIYAQDGTPLTNVTEATGSSFESIQSTVAADKKARLTLNDTDDTRFILSYRTKPISLAEYNIASKIITCTDPNASNNDDTDMICSITSPELMDTRSNTIAKADPSVDADYLGNFTVTWVDESIDGDQYGIAGQSYNYKGQAVNNPFQINGTITTDNQGYAAIAVNTDGFYDISFYDYGTTNVYFKKYVTEIYKIDNETYTHTPDPTNPQSTVVTDLSSTHNQVMVWMDYGTSPTSLKFTLQQIDRSDPSAPTLIQLQNEQTIITGNNVDNPSVSFFKDDLNCNKFIVTWENDTGLGKDIFYQIFDSSGNPEYGSPQTLIATGASEVKPTVSAGIYNNGTTDVKIFTIGWIDETNSKIESMYHNNDTFTQTTISADCNGEPCVDVKNSLNPNNNRVIYMYQTGIAELAGNIYLQQLDGYTLVGNPVEVNSAETWNFNGDLDFIKDDEFAVVYATGSNDDIQGSRYIFDATLGGDSDQNPDLIEDFDISQTYVSGISTEQQDLYPKISGFPTGETAKQQFLIVWNLTFPNNLLTIMGQFIDYSDTNVQPFGPSFMINSTQTGDNYLPDVAYNQYGLGVVTWEADTTLDNAAVVYQLLQNPSISEDMAPLEPLCRQEITAGGLTMTAPTSISFPPAATSATETVTQEVSIRDATYGGDIKYIEVQDATGQDFTLSMQVSNFTSLADGKTYITADEHFKVKNWDGDTTDTDTGCEAGTPLNCYLTEASTYTPTAFSLNSETETYTYVDTQKVLANKTGTEQFEIGKWKFYPKFEITIPPIIPPGLHEATITFTLVN